MKRIKGKNSDYQVKWEIVGYSYVEAVVYRQSSHMKTVWHLFRANQEVEVKTSTKVWWEGNRRDNRYPTTLRWVMGADPSQIEDWFFYAVEEFERYCVAVKLNQEDTDEDQG